MSPHSKMGLARDARLEPRGAAREVKAAKVPPPKTFREMQAEEI